MESNITPTPPKYQQVVVDVPEDRVAEFHAFFARFLEGSRGRRRGHRHGRRRYGHHGRHCGERREAAQREAAERADVTERPAGTTEV